MVVLLSLVLMAGCEFAAQDDLKVFVRNAGKDMVGKVDRVPAVAVAELPVYSAGEARDPFDMREFVHVPVRPPRDRREPLEEFALDSLKLVGVVSLNGQSHVLVRTPSGVLFVGKVGGYIGQNFGTIRAIDEQGIEITELVVDPADQSWVERQTRVKL
jgi:type IV pilus assembly protein PilP